MNSTMLAAFCFRNRELSWATHKEKCLLWLHLEGFSSRSVGSVLEACGVHDARDTWRCKAANLMTGKQKNQGEEGAWRHYHYPPQEHMSQWLGPPHEPNVIYTAQSRVLCYSNTKWTKMGPVFLEGIVKNGLNRKRTYPSDDRHGLQHCPQTGSAG